MELNRSASAMGLYEYGSPHPGSALFSRFYSVATNLFQSLGIQPTFIGAEGDGYSGKFTKFGGRTQTRLVKSGFSGITVLSLAANPSTSDAPSYDSFAMTSLSYFDSDRELLLCLVINEVFVKLRSAQFDRIVDALARFHHWDFGFGYSGNVADQPELHILGMDNGRLSTEERKLLNAWYAAPAKMRTTRLRDVYPYNLLNDQQLHEEIEPGVDLKAFIEQHPGCKLTQLTDDGLHEWKVSDDITLHQLRTRLRCLPIIVQ